MTRFSAGPRREAMHDRWHDCSGHAGKDAIRAFYRTTVAIVWFGITAPQACVWANTWTERQALIREFWYDGAEINRYELNQNCYGEQHRGHCELIFVTEPFDLQQQVKDERGNEASIDVLKLNALRRFHTGLYSYRSMVSTFQPVDMEHYPHPLKSSASIQDWCGQTFQQMNRQAQGWLLRMFSYFQRMGDRELQLANAYLEDALWLQIRLNPEKLPRGEFAIIPGAFHCRMAHLQPQALPAVARLHKGTKTWTYSLVYQNHDRELTVDFDAEFPHVIRAWQTRSQQGTTSAVLRKRWMHCNYWEHNQPQDRNLRRKLDLDPDCN